MSTVQVMCPRCGKQFGVIKGYTAVWCYCPPQKPREKRRVLMMPVDVGCPLVKQDA